MAVLQQTENNPLLTMFRSSFKSQQGYKKQRNTQTLKGNSQGKHLMSRTLYATQRALMNYMRLFVCASVTTKFIALLFLLQLMCFVCFNDVTK